MGNHFSGLDRTGQLRRVTSHTFDLAVVGGGVTGAGIALDAASRGLNVLLLEKGDFASGTSSKSTKLIHGGLRYLKQFEFGLVKETGMERAIVHRLAPHLAVPEKMLLPFVKDGTYGSMSTSVGLKIYDFLADVVQRDKRRMLNSVKTLAAEPLLNRAIVEGGGIYSEYRTDDARLTMEILKTAHRYEALALNYCKVTRFNYLQGRVSGLTFRDMLTGQEHEAQANVTVAAVGSWLDGLVGSQSQKKLRLTKGVHIVVPYEKFPLRQPVYFDTPDERMVFAIPRGKVTYIGTTDTEYHGTTDRVVATKDDLHYLMGALKRVFPQVDLAQGDVISNWAGLRPLIEEEGKAPSELSRKDETYELEPGLLAIAGGKLTGYRRMAERIVDRVLEELDLPYKLTCRTERIPLTEDPFLSDRMVKKAVRHYTDLAVKCGMDGYLGWYLVMTYGSNASKIWRQFEEGAQWDEEALVKAELWYVVHHEMVLTAGDFLVRRTGWLYFDIEAVRKYRYLVLQELSGHYGWDEPRIKLENREIDRFLDDATTYYESEKAAP